MTNKSDEFVEASKLIRTTIVLLFTSFVLTIGEPDIIDGIITYLTK